MFDIDSYRLIVSTYIDWKSSSISFLGQILKYKL